MNLHTTDWNKFRTFYHVAKAGSFTKAAENLHICQPSLTRSIMSLEASLKMRLLKRSSKGVIPTEEGKVLLETVDAMLNAFLRYGEKLNNKSEEPQGLLKVAMLKTLPSLHLSWLIPKFLKAYPRMKLALVKSDREVGFSTYQADAAIREKDNCMFLNFPKKKFILTILFTLSYFTSAQVSFADPKNESLAVKENLLGVKEGSVEERLLEAQHRNKQLSAANKDLTVRNDLLKKERDFYLKEATIYKEIVEKMEVQKIETVENRSYAKEAKGIESVSGGGGVISTDGSTSKSQTIRREGEGEEEIIDYTGTKDTVKEVENRDHYIKSLENQLQLVNTILQTLQKKTSLTDLSPLDSLSIIINEQQEFQKEHRLLQQKYAALAEVHVETLKLKEEIEQLKKNANSNPEESAEERMRQISTLREELKRLRGGVDAEENERKKKEIEDKTKEITALQEEVEKLKLIADPVENERKKKEIEDKTKKITALQEEVEKLRSGEELAEYGRKIKSLEMELIRLLGMAIESPPGQTPVWLPLNFDIFFHSDRLKSQPATPEQPLKDSMQLLKNEYDRIKGTLTGLPRLNMKALDELDVRDVTTFDVVAQNMARIDSVKSPLVQDCKRLFNNTLEVYNDFHEQKKQEIPGLTQYINLQNVYRKISDKISLDKFAELMEHFDKAKEIFANLLKNRASLFTGKEVAPYSKLINWLELEYKDFTLSNFIKRYTIAPGKAEKDYHNSPFVLLWQQTGMGQKFIALGLATITHHKTHFVTPGLEEVDPFKIFRQEVQNNPLLYSDISENLINLVENMYMMKYLNVRWKRLQETRFDQDLVQAIRECNLRNSESKPLLEESVKNTLCSILQEDFLQRPAIVHATTAKELDDKLRTSLLHENVASWKSSARPTLREELIDIYTTYRGLSKGAFALHAKNPKIKEFHEE